MLQVQVPSKHHNHNLNSDIEDKAARDNDDAGNSDSYSCNRNRNNYPSEPSDSDFGISDDCKFVHDPGVNDINTKDTSTSQRSQHAADSTIISNEPRTADAYCSFGRDCDKIISSESPSDFDPTLG